MEPAFSSCRAGAAARAGAPGAEGAALVLPERLDTAAAAALGAELLAQRGADLTIDASRVSFVGALCAQVLLAARETWAADGRGWTLVAPGAAFAEGVRALGLPCLDPTEKAAG